MLQVANPPPPGSSTHAPTPAPSFISAYEGELSIIVIALGAVIIIALSLVLRKKESSAEDVVRAYALVIILIGTLVLICAGYSNDQIAPAMGLFGTVAGYLLGRKSQ